VCKHFLEPGASELQKGAKSGCETSNFHRLRRAWTEKVNLAQGSKPDLDPVTTDRSTTQKHQLKQTVALRAFAPVIPKDVQIQIRKGQGIVGRLLQTQIGDMGVTHDRNSWNPNQQRGSLDEAPQTSNGKFDPNVNTEFK